MNFTFGKYVRAGAISVCLFFCSLPGVLASHMLGDEFTYQYLGDTTIGSAILQKYRITLNIYIDCLNGQPEAIATDNPAYLGVFTSSGSSLTEVEIDTNVYSSSYISVPATASGPCGIGTVPALCVMKRTFIHEYYLPASSTGYTIAYQRCCKNLALTNVIHPGDSGSTYLCTIPLVINNSAVFTYDPPEIAAINQPFIYHSSATDADGDSLSYELCTAYSGADNPDNSKPYPSGPPYTAVSYVSPLSYAAPLSCIIPLAIDPVTGILTGTPNVAGRYLIAVCCHEWRAGVMINTVHREFELAVGDFAVGGTYQPYAGADTAIMVGDSMQFHGSGAVTYLWTPGTYLTDTTISNPIGHFPVAGYYTYILHGVSDSGCTGSDTINVTVLAHSEYRVANAFTPNGDGINDHLTPVPLENSTLISFKVYNRDGRLLYNANTEGDGWDGTYNGVKQPIGTYMWSLFYRDNTGQTRQMSGNAILMR